MTTVTWEASAEGVWKLFRETDKQFKEMQKEIRERDARRDKEFKEMNAQRDKEIKEMNARLDKEIKETTKQINKVSGTFSSQWGKMIEAIVEPNAIKLFQERGIKVQYILRRVEVKIDDRTMELDIVLENGHEVVIIEVKSTLRVSDVKEFLSTLDNLLYFFPRYQNYQIYGGVAGMNIDKGAGRYAYKKGLFVLSAAGDGLARIKNDRKFVPTDFGSERNLL